MPLIALPASTAAIDTSQLAGCVATGSKGSCQQRFVGGDYFGATFIDQSGHRYRYTVRVHKKGRGKPVYVKTTRRRFVELSSKLHSVGRFRVTWSVKGRQVAKWSFRYVAENAR